MSVRYLQSGDEPAGSLLSGGQIDEGADSWWAGAQRCFASVAIAAALVASTLAAHIASGIQQDAEEIPAGSLKKFSTPDEDYWPPYAQGASGGVAPVAATLYQRLPYLPDLSDDPAGSLKNFSTPDEDFWQNPVAPAQLIIYQRLPLLDLSDDPAATLHGQVDEDYWQNPVFPPAASIYQRLPYLPELEEPPAGSLLKFGSAEEEYWQNAVSPIPGSVSQPLPIAASEPAEIVAQVVFQPDEDYWPPYAQGASGGVAPVPAALYQPLPYLRDPSDEPGQFHGIIVAWYAEADAVSTTGYNIYRGNAGPGSEGSIPINPSPVDVGAAAGSLCTYNDSNIQWGVTYWYTIYSNDTSTGIQSSSPSTEVSASYPPVIDEDYWQNPVSAVPAALYRSLPYLPEVSDDPAGALAKFSTPEEDYWGSPAPYGAGQGPVAPAPFAIYQELPYDPDPEEIPSGALAAVPEEFYWQNPVLPVSLAIFQELPYDPDPEEIPASTLARFTSPDEDYWQNPAASVPASIYQPLPYATGESAEITPQTVLPPDEDFWTNPVAPSQAAVYQRLPYLPELSDDPAGSLAKLPGPDEDYWQNPVQQWRAEKSSFRPSTLDFTTLAGEAAEIVASVAFTPDEDCWRNPVQQSNLQQTNFRPSTLDFSTLSDEPAGSLYGVPTETEWQNWAAPVAALISQRLPYAWGEAAEILPSVRLTVDEDCWQNPIIPASALYRPAPGQAALVWAQPAVYGFDEFSSYWWTSTWGVWTHSAARGRVSHSAARERISRSAVRPRTSRGTRRQSSVVSGQ